jgi:hypothetical protein
MGAVVRSLSLLKRALEESRGNAMYRSSAIQTLRINGYENQARELEECEGDPERLRIAVDKVLGELPRSSHLQPDSSGCLPVLVILGLAGLLWAL